MKRDDTLWKGILENTFDDFLRFVFKDADKLLDLEKGFQFLDKELEQLFPSDDAGHPKFVDKLVKVCTKEGKDEWILVHVEVQGYNDENFALRMFTYFYRILDRYRKPVTAIAILTDNNKDFRPTTYQYDFLGTKNVFSFNTYKVIDQQQAVLSSISNPFAIVVLTVLLALKNKQLNDEDIFSLKLDIVRNLQKHAISEEKRRALMNFLRFYVRFADPEFNAKFDDTILSITENKTTMGIEEMLIERFKKEGRKEGMKEGMKEGIEAAKGEVVKNLLTAGKFSIAEIVNFANVTEAFVNKVQHSVQ